MLNSIAIHSHPPNHGYHFNLAARYSKHEDDNNRTCLNFDKFGHSVRGSGSMRIESLTVIPLVRKKSKIGDSLKLAQVLLILSCAVL